MGFAAGVGLGLAVAATSPATPQARDGFGTGDHYEMAWTVMAAGQVVCVGPYVRPSEREIECRHVRVAVLSDPGR